MSIRLSIIIPAFNAERTIGDCLSSVLSKLGEDAEVIVVDDGSTDETVAACQPYCCDALRIYEQHNRGVSAARNTGIGLSRGAYLMFVDADDVLATGWYAAVASYLDCGEDVIVFSGSAERERFSTDELVGSIVGIGLQKEEKEEAPKIPWVTAPFSKMYSRPFLQENGIEFDTNVINGEDALFNLESFLRTSHIKFVGKSLYSYRIHSGSATHTFDSRFFASNEAYLIKLDDLLSRFSRYSASERRRAADFSFCRSIEIMAIRAALVDGVAERRNATREISDNSLVCARLSKTVAIESNCLHERIVYHLAKHGLLGFAVAMLRLALAAKGNRKNQERWVNI